MRRTQGTTQVQKTLLKELQATQDRSNSAVETFFILLAQFVDGDQEVLERRIKEIDSLIDRQKDWGIAYALRARVRGEIARKTKNEDDYRLAINDFEIARDRLPESSLVNMTGLWLMIDQIQLAESQDGDTTEMRQRALVIANTFADVERTASGVELAANFHFHYGDAAEGERILESLVEFSGAKHVVGATESITTNSTEPMNDLRERSDPEAQFVPRDVISLFNAR